MNIIFAVVLINSRLPNTAMLLSYINMSSKEKVSCRRRRNFVEMMCSCTSLGDSSEHSLVIHILREIASFFHVRVACLSCLRRSNDQSILQSLFRLLALPFPAGLIWDTYHKNSFLPDAQSPNPKYNCTLRYSHEFSFS